MMNLRLIVASLLLSFPILARAETVELVTYYPAPGGGNVETDRLHADAGTIGDDYSLTVPAALDNGTLLVWDRMGVGLGQNLPAGPLHVVGRNNVVESVVFMPGTGAGVGIRMGIGTTNPATELETASISTAQPRGILSSQFNNGTHAAQFIGAKARGTPTLPAAVVNGDNLAGFIPAAYDGTSFQQTGWLGWVANGTVATGSVPSDFVLHTGSNNQGAERLRVTSGGNVGVGNGYAPGTAVPAGTADGNLDVNDVFLRSVNGWASQLNAACKRYATTSQALVHNTNTPVIFGNDPRNFSSGGMTSNASSEIIIPADGVYEVTVAFGWTSGVGTTIWATIMKNGQAPANILAWYTTWVDGAWGGVLQGSEYFQFNAGDRISMGMLQNTGGTINSQISPSWCTPRISVVRVR